MMERTGKYKEYYARNRERIIATQKRWYLKNQDKVKRYRKSEKYRALVKQQNRRRMEAIKDWTLRKNFGISIKEFYELLEKQNHRCAICRRKDTTNGRWGSQRLSVDHCHKSKKVRGLLCRRCNTGIGLFDDDPKLLGAAARYTS
jgi:hypothetical protein